MFPAQMLGWATPSSISYDKGLRLGLGGWERGSHPAAPKSIPRSQPKSARWTHSFLAVRIYHSAHYSQVARSLPRHLDAIPHRCPVLRVLVYIGCNTTLARFGVASCTGNCRQCRFQRRTRSFAAPSRTWHATAFPSRSGVAYRRPRGHQNRRQDVLRLRLGQASATTERHVVECGSSP